MNALLLSHHPPGQYDRCIRIGRHHVCRRCAVLYPLATFIYNCFFRLGFLDSREGLLLHVNHSVYIHWKFIKAWWVGQGKEIK